MNELYEQIKKEVMDEYEKVKNNPVSGEYSQLIIAKNLSKIYIYDYPYTIKWTKEFVKAVEDATQLYKKEYPFVEVDYILDDENCFIGYEIISYSIRSEESLEEFIDEKFRQRLSQHLANLAGHKGIPRYISKNIAQKILNWELDTITTSIVLYS